MLKNDTLKNGTSRIGLYGSPPPRVEAEPVLEVGAETSDKAGKCQQASTLKKMT